jgi:hypothetical protein
MTTTNNILYWYPVDETPTGGGDWNLLSNWWLDEQHTIQANSLPTSTTTVIAKETVFSNTGQVPTVANFILKEIEGSFLNIPIVVTEFAIFSDGVYLGWPITGNVIFNTNAYNASVITGNVVFNDSSLNFGSIEGNVTFNHNSRNLLNYVEIINGDAVFNDNAINEWTINGDATFNGTSLNRGTINGDATFNNLSHNEGNVTGTAILNDGSCNSGTAGIFIPNPPPSCLQLKTTTTTTSPILIETQTQTPIEEPKNTTLAAEEFPTTTTTPKGQVQPTTETPTQTPTETPTQTPTETPTQTQTEPPTQTPTEEPPTPKTPPPQQPTMTTMASGGGIMGTTTTPPLGCPDYPPAIFQTPFVGYDAISGQETIVTWIRTENTWSTSGQFPCGIAFYMSMTCDPITQKFYYDIGCNCCGGIATWEFPPNGVSDTPLIIPGEISPVKATFDLNTCPLSCFVPGPDRRGGFSPGRVGNARPVLLTINWNPDPNDPSTNGGSATFRIANPFAFAAEGIVE